MSCRSTAARRSPTPRASSGSPSGSSTPSAPATTSSSWSPRWATPPTSCIDLAQQVVPAARRPRARHAAHRGRAHLDGAARDGDRQPRPGGPVVHRQPGRRDHRQRARQGQDHRRHPRPHRAGARGGRDRDRRRLPGRQPGHQGHHHARAGAAPTPPRSRWPRPCGADVCEIYSDVDGVFTADPRIVPTARKLDRVSYEEMLEMAACGAKILHLRCVEYARRYDMPIHVRSSFSQKHRHLDRDRSRGGRHGAGDHRRRRARPQRGQDHRRRRARQGRRGGPDLRDARRRRRSTST